MCEWREEGGNDVIIISNIKEITLKTFKYTSLTIMLVSIKTYLLSIFKV